MKRVGAVLLTIVLALSGFLAMQATSVQAAQQPPYECSKTWHYIRAVINNQNVELPDDMPSSPAGLFATGGPDFWNQQFIFCRHESWGAGHYGIQSNHY